MEELICIYSCQRQPHLLIVSKDRELTHIILHLTFIL